MHLSFRTKLLTTVGTAVFAFLILICAETFLTAQMQRGSLEIQERFIPLLEFGPRLGAHFEHLRRSFQDSVSAQDPEALKKTQSLLDDFHRDLATVEKVIGPAQTAGLGGATDEYYASASAVARRLIAGETGTTLVSAMTLMQDKQLRVESILKSALALDRSKLEGAFSAIARAQETSGRMLLFISIASMVTVILLALGLSRGVLRSLAGLSKGFNRFGAGDFSKPIPVTSTDELGALASEANQMADRIAGLLKELGSFSYSVAHDLRAPLRSIQGFSNMVLEDHGPALPADAKESLERVMFSARKMGELVDGLLSLSRLTRAEMKKGPVDLSTMAQEVLAELKNSGPGRAVDIGIEPGILALGDAPLLRIVLSNLLGNAWKYTSKKERARIDFGSELQDGKRVYFVRDNGAGFDMKYASKLFGTFQRLHSSEEFEGTGIGLATVQRIMGRHGGEAWAEAKPDQGAAFFFAFWKRPVSTDAQPASG